MEEKVISEKEKLRRQKLSERMKEKRRKGYERYLKKRRREIAKRKQAEALKKEKEKIKKQKEREKKKLKKKVGRPKKSGPKINYYKRNKKKNKILLPLGRKALPPYRYKIISCCNGLQNKFIGRYRNIEDAYEIFHELKKQDENVIFPKLIMGLGTLEDSINEYILIEKQDKDNIEVVKLRNEYGKLVEQVSNIEGWNIIDKFKYKKEETFWVFGYNNRNDRKTFSWIYENILLNDIESPYDFKRVILFKNKIIIKNDFKQIDLIICKHPTDAMRFYNKLEEFIKKEKIKQIIFAGDYSTLSDRRKKLTEEIIELTGWDMKRIYMSTTSFNKTNKKE